MCCEHGDRRVSVLTKDGGKLTLADRYQGKRLNSPNDAALKSNGDIYFTDPPYGLPQRYDDPRRELDHCGVYRIGTDGKLTLLSTALERPNGIGFSPDEKTLYVAQSDPRRRFGWRSQSRKMAPWAKANCSTMPRNTWATSIQVCPTAWLWIKLETCGPAVLAESGCLARWKTAGQTFDWGRTSNCKFGEDGSSLFITADTYLCRVKTKTKGK